MPEWLVQLLGPLAGGAVSGLMMVGAIRAEVKALHETVTRAHVRIDDHLESHRK